MPPSVRVSLALLFCASAQQQLHTVALMPGDLRNKHNCWLSSWVWHREAGSFMAGGLPP